MAFPDLDPHQTFLASVRREGAYLSEEEKREFDSAIIEERMKGNAIPISIRERLVVSYLHKILGSSHRECDRPEDAEDIFQNTAYNVWRRSEKYNPELASFSTYVDSVINSTKMDAARKRVRMQIETTSLNETHNELTDKSDEINERFKRESIDDLRSSMKILKRDYPHCHKVIVLYFGLGEEEAMTTRKIAERLECSRQNVNQLLTFAIQQLIFLVRGIKVNMDDINVKAISQMFAQKRHQPITPPPEESRNNPEETLRSA